MKELVTRDSLARMLENPNKTYVINVIGRALVAIFNRQTEDEKTINDTRVWNAMGFSGADAKSGSLTAKYFLKHKTLLEWQVEKWTKKTRGYPRLCKYHKQLNEVANQKESVSH